VAKGQRLSSSVTVNVAAALAMKVAAGVALADDRAPPEALVQYSVEILYSRLVLDQRSKEAAFETVLNAHGVAGEPVKSVRCRRPRTATCTSGCAMPNTAS
jgi:hypothetical protein